MEEPQATEARELLHQGLVKLPKKLQIGPHRYTVVTGPEADTVIAEDGRNLNGLAQVPQQRIAIISRQGPDQMADTLLHEVLHAIFFQSALSEVDTPVQNAGEAIITTLAPMLLDTLRRNPDLVVFLLGE